MKKIFISLFLSSLFCSSLFGHSFFDTNGGPLLYSVEDTFANNKLFNLKKSGINDFRYRTNFIWLAITHKKDAVLSVKYKGNIAQGGRGQDAYLDTDRVSYNIHWFNNVYYSWFRVARPSLVKSATLLNIRVNGSNIYQILTLE